MKSLAIVAFAAFQSGSALHLNKQRTKAESTVDLETVPPRTALDAGCTKKAVDQLTKLYTTFTEEGRGSDDYTTYNFGVKFLHACQRMDMYYNDVVDNPKEKPLLETFTSILEHCAHKVKDYSGDLTVLGIPTTYTIEDYEVVDLGDANGPNFKVCLDSVSQLHGKHNRETVKSLFDNFVSRCSSVDSSPEEYEDEVLLTGAIDPEEFMQWAPEEYTECVDPSKYPTQEEKKANKNPYNVVIPEDRCCKICKKGYACRNSCISPEVECQYRLDFHFTDKKKEMMNVNLPGCACDANFTCKRGATPEEWIDDEPTTPKKDEKKDEDKTPEKPAEDPVTPPTEEDKTPDTPTEEDKTPTPPTEDKPIKPHDGKDDTAEPTEPKKTDDEKPEETPKEEEKPKTEDETKKKTEGTATPPGDTPNGDNEKKKGGFCFPSAALFTREDGSQIRADKLQIGDRILVVSEQDQKPSFEPVVFFAVNQPNAVAPMKRLTMSSGHILSLTGTHFVNVRKGNHSPEAIIRSEQVEVGDGMWVIAPNGARIPATVVKTETVTNAEGLFAPVPLTASRIVVDGVEASTWGAFVSFGLFHETLAPTVYASLRAAILRPLFALANVLEGPELMARGVAAIWGDGSGVMSADAALSSACGQECLQASVLLLSLVWFAGVGKKKQAA